MPNDGLKIPGGRDYAAVSLMRRSELRFAFSDNVESDQGGEGADEGADRHRSRGADHAAENQRPDAHDAAAHFAGEDQLQKGVRD